MELEEKIIPWESVLERRSLWNEKKIVFTNGCFDILHRGHVEYLFQARRLGDVLWLGLNSDQSVKTLKGTNRPVNSEWDRAVVLSGLASIDAITIFPQNTPIELIRMVKPSIHTKGGDYDPESLPETPIVRSFGGEVVILPFLDGKSTTSILKKLEKT